MDEQPETSAPENSPIRQPMPRGLLPWAILGGVLLAIIVIVAVAIFVVPSLLRTTHPAYGVGAVASLRTIAMAQSNWHKNDSDGNGVSDYASRYLALYYQPVNGQPARLIGKFLADACGPGGTPYNEYRFVDITGDANGPYDYKVAFGACAYPAKYGRYGNQTFIIDASGSIYQKDAGGKPVTTWPKDLKKEGWILVH